MRTREFLELARSGDSSAERQIFDRLLPELLEQARRHKLMRRLRKVTTAEDIVSEVWVRWYSSGCLFAFEDRGKGSLRSFLCQMLNNVMVDEARRTGALKRRALFGRGAAHGCTRDDGAERMEELPDRKAPTPTSNSRAREWIELCREILDDREWSVWSMTEIDGLDASEIGARLGLTAAAVRSMRNRLKAKLLVRLSRLGANET